MSRAECISGPRLVPFLDRFHFQMSETPNFPRTRLCWHADLATVDYTASDTTGPQTVGLLCCTVNGSPMLSNYHVRTTDLVTCQIGFPISTPRTCGFGAGPPNYASAFEAFPTKQHKNPELKTDISLHVNLNLTATTYRSPFFNRSTGLPSRPYRSVFCFTLFL